MMWRSKRVLGALTLTCGLIACGHSRVGPQQEAGGKPGGTSGEPGAVPTVGGADKVEPPAPGDAGESTGGFVMGGGGAGGNAGAGSGGVGGSGGSGGRAVVAAPTFANYAITGAWPERPVAIETRPGKLAYTKVLLHGRFLAESCAIGDYDGDGVVDVSAGRRWYSGPFAPGLPVVEHIFRDGHEDLPRNGDGPEIETGVSDDQADYAYDVDRDGDVDIINIASPDVNDALNANPAPAPQPHATAYWYENPGPELAKSDAPWTPHLMHADVRLEQHVIGDVDGDGRPEIVGACKACTSIFPQTFGFYKQDPDPKAPWFFQAVTEKREFPFQGTGWMHGIGLGDVNGDGHPDLLERNGIWLRLNIGRPNTERCPSPGCGFVETQLYGGGAGPDLGGSHMFAFDVDGDGDGDIVSADFAHNYGISWYEQTAPLTFVKHQFVGGPQDVFKYGVQFSEPHALEVADMDGDGIPDIVTGKMRFANPNGCGDPDLLGPAVVYVFRTVRKPNPALNSPVTFEPYLVDSTHGIGRQIAVGHLNDDGIPDLCLATKLGLAVFLGQ